MQYLKWYVARLERNGIDPDISTMSFLHIPDSVVWSLRNLTGIAINELSEAQGS
jgi:hypothetical protein